MKKQLLLFILTLLPMLAMADDSGSCGTNVTWTYNSTTKTLTIQGSGAMTNYSYSSSPWYSYRTNIKTVIIEEGVTSIGNFAFRDCKGLTSVTIPNGVTSIGQSAFEGCTGLTSVTIPNSVTSIRSGAFFGCTGLQKVIVPDIAAWCGISFGDNPLEYAHHIYSDENTEIKNLVIPNSVTSIGQEAFWNCSGLTSVTIPNSVTSIGRRAFSGCLFTSITIPNSVTSIGSDAFWGCPGLTSVTIPNSVKSIGDYAFFACSGLTSVTIGSGVTSIGDYAFSCGIKLSTVNVNMNIPIEIDESVFLYTGENYSSDIIYLVATLNVPKGSKNLYSNVKGWKKFANIEEFDVTNIAAQYRSKDAKIVDVYQLNGQRINEVRRGVNIIRMSDGTTRKVVVK